MAFSTAFLRQPTSGNLFEMRKTSVHRATPTSVEPQIPFPDVSFRRLSLDAGRFSPMGAWAVRSSDSSNSGINLLEVPVWSTSEVVERLKALRENRSNKQNYMAMYSSVIGGITTDPVSMMIPMDDHMVHRGHGVFDTAAIMNGYLYELDQHLDRFIRSASMARIQLPFDKASIRSILIRTVSASKCTQGSLRYWLSAGPGDFLLSPSGCPEPALYAIVIEGRHPQDPKGVKVITSMIPMKPQQFAIMKSVNYLPNALSKMEAEDEGAFAAIWLDDEGYVAEGPNMNVAFVTSGKELLMPRFDKILSGCTAKRVLVLAQQLVDEGKLAGIKIRNVSVEEGKAADEMMLIGSGIIVKPVLQWDEHSIGDGKKGPVAQDLFNLIVEDMKSGPSAVRESVGIAKALAAKNGYELDSNQETDNPVSHPVVHPHYSTMAPQHSHVWTSLYPGLFPNVEERSSENRVGGSTALQNWA